MIKNGLPFLSPPKLVDFLKILSLVNFLKRGKVASKAALGAILLLFLLNYQPTLDFPPYKHNLTYAQTDQTATISAQPSPFQFQLPFSGYLSTSFSSYHPGIDIAGGLGLPVKPIAAGKITEVGYNFWGLGLMAVVDHGQGYKSLYAHLGKTYVSKDKQVTENDYLGEIGMTGNTSGPHIHLEISKDSKNINPSTILPQIRQIPIASDFEIAGGQYKLLPSKTQAPKSTPKPQKEKEDVQGNLKQILNILPNSSAPDNTSKIDQILLPKLKTP